MQRLSGRWQLGFWLALTTAVLWGAVPLAMTPLIAHLDAVTISWFRFASSGLCLLAFFAARGRLQWPRSAGRTAAWLFALAVLMLIGNYVLYVQSLHFIAAPVAQTVVQLAPVLLMLLSLWLFGERFTTWQWGGFVLLLGGITAFCAERLRVSGAGIDIFSTGVGLMVLAAALWAVYGVAQKRLLRYLPSQFVLMGIYLASALLMLPAASPGALAALGATELGLLAFLAANTLIAYGAFAEALNHWESSKVSAVLALQPLTTLFGAAALGALFPVALPRAAAHRRRRGCVIRLSWSRARRSARWAGPDRRSGFIRTGSSVRPDKSAQDRCDPYGT
jgi:drug/metabolite transporter (DMT)-like permease